MSDRLDEAICLVQGLKRYQEARFSLRKGKEFKGDLADNAQSSKGTDQEFTHIITGDILDCLPARHYKITIWENGLHSDDQIPSRPIEQSFGPLELVATTPPKVALSVKGGSSGKKYPFPSFARCL